MIKTFNAEGQILIEFSLCCFLLICILVACGNFFYQISTKIYCNKIIFEKTRKALYQKKSTTPLLLGNKSKLFTQIIETPKTVSGIAKCKNTQSKVTFQKLNQIIF